MVVEVEVLLLLLLLLLVLLLVWLRWCAGFAKVAGVCGLQQSPLPSAADAIEASARKVACRSGVATAVIVGCGL
jgi:hypothetical protein